MSATAVSPKVTAAALGAALAAILVWAVEAGAHIDVPQAPEAGIVVLLTFAAGYLVRDPHRDPHVPDGTGRHRRDEDADGAG